MAAPIVPAPITAAVRMEGTTGKTDGVLLADGVMAAISRRFTENTRGSEAHFLFADR